MQTLTELHQKYPATRDAKFLEILKDWLEAGQILSGMPEISHDFEDQRAATQLIAAQLRSLPYSIEGDDLYDISEDPVGWIVQIDTHQLQEGAA